MSSGRGLQLLRALQAVEFPRAHILISPVRPLCLTYGYSSPHLKNKHHRQQLPATRAAPQLSAAPPSSTGDLCLPVARCRHSGCRPHRRAPPPPMAVAQPRSAPHLCLLPPRRPPLAAVSSPPCAAPRPWLPTTPAACCREAHVTATAAGGCPAACALRFLGVAVGWWSARAGAGRCLLLSSFFPCVRKRWTPGVSVFLMWFSSGAVDRLNTRRPPVSLAVHSAPVLYLGEESV